MHVTQQHPYKQREQYTHILLGFHICPSPYILCTLARAHANYYVYTLSHTHAHTHTRTHTCTHARTHAHTHTCTHTHTHTHTDFLKAVTREEGVRKRGPSGRAVRPRVIFLRKSFVYPACQLCVHSVCVNHAISWRERDTYSICTAHFVVCFSQLKPTGFTSPH